MYLLVCAICTLFVVHAEVRDAETEFALVVEGAVRGVSLPSLGLEHVLGRAIGAY